MFMKSRCLQLRTQVFCSIRCFCKYKKPFDRLVKPVDNGKVGIFFLRAAFVQVVFQDAEHVRNSDSAALGRSPCRFDADKQLRVLI